MVVACHLTCTPYVDQTQTVALRLLREGPRNGKEAYGLLPFGAQPSPRPLRSRLYRISSTLWPSLLTQISVPHAIGRLPNLVPVTQPSKNRLNPAGPNSGHLDRPARETRSLLDKSLFESDVEVESIRA